MVQAQIARLLQRIELNTDRGEVRGFLYELENNRPPSENRDASLISLQRISNRQPIVAASLVDKSGVVVLSTDPAEVGRNVEKEVEFNAGLSAPHLGLPRWAHGRFEALLAAPIRTRSQPDRVCGVLLATADVSPLADALQDVSGFRQTGEAILCVREGDQLRFLFPPRNAPSATGTVSKDRVATGSPARPDPSTPRQPVLPPRAALRMTRVRLSVHPLRPPLQPPTDPRPPTSVGEFPRRRSSALQTPLFKCVRHKTANSAPTGRAYFALAVFISTGLFSSSAVHGFVRLLIAARTLVTKPGVTGEALCSHSRRMYVRMPATSSSLKIGRPGISSCHLVPLTSIGPVSPCVTMRMMRSGEPRTQLESKSGGARPGMPAPDGWWQAPQIQGQLPQLIGGAVRDLLRTVALQPGVPVGLHRIAVAVPPAVTNGDRLLAAAARMQRYRQRILARMLLGGTLGGASPTQEARQVLAKMGDGHADAQRALNHTRELSSQPFGTGEGVIQW